MVVKKELLYQGKAKSLYATDTEDLLWVEFRDDTTAFDGAKKEALTQKGHTNNLLSEHFMQVLAKAGIPTHFVQRLSETVTLVRPLKMIPLESVVRNIAAGSICRRLGLPPKQPLSPPTYELFYKNDALHDPLVNESVAMTLGWATAAQLERMQVLSLKINEILKAHFAKAGLIFVDAKYEFGVYKGEVVLGDEISPDSCRIWDAKTLEPLDKDRFRQDLGHVVESYQIIAQRLGVGV